MTVLSIEAEIKKYQMDINSLTMPIKQTVQVLCFPRDEAPESAKEPRKRRL